MYAGGMFFDKGDDTLYMTGIHYNEDMYVDSSQKQFLGKSPNTEKSSCFVASMRLAVDEDNSSIYEYLGIEDWRSYVNDVEQESCMALAMHSPSQIVVIGTKEHMKADSPPMEGSIAVFNRNNLSSKKLSETTLVDQDETMTQLVYPVAITSDKKSPDSMYIVILASKNAQDNSDGLSGPYPNWLHVQKYGSSFDMHVSKIKLTQGGGGGIDGIPTGSIVASKKWTTEFPLENPEDRVFIGGIIHKMTADNDLVIVVGSTRGAGRGYGLSDGNDEDGFVTVIDPSTGEILGDGAREGSDEDDIVTGICDDPNDPDHFFIVGATEGRIGKQQAKTNSVNVPEDMLQPFLRQVKADRSSSDEDNRWTMQWAVTKGSRDSPAFASAIGCVVDGNSVYVAGTVDSGASMVQGDNVMESQGGDDVWVVKIDKIAERVEWISQLGSEGDDRLARYGGIEIDNEGHPMIFGNTNGGIFRTRDSSEDDSVDDVFVMSLDKLNGNILDNPAGGFKGGVSTLQFEQGDFGSDTGDPTFNPTVLASISDTDPFTETITGSDFDDSDFDNDDLEDDYSDDGTIFFPTESPTFTAMPTVTGWPTDMPTTFPTPTQFVLDDPTSGPTVFDAEDNEESSNSGNSHSYSAIGLQIQGPAYAGGIVYDSKENNVILTGATYLNAKKDLNPTSLCFTGVVNLDAGNLMLQTPRGSYDFGEACNAITFDTNRNAVYAVGVAETDYQGQVEGGCDGDLIAPSGGSDWAQGDYSSDTAGLILQMDEHVQLLGGNRIFDVPAVFPVSVVTHPLDKDYLYVASMGSKNNYENEDFKANQSYPNFLDRENLKYGSEFFLMVNRYQVTDVPKMTTDDEFPKTVEKSWYSEFGTDGGEDALVSGMVMAGNGNVLVVVGSTRGGGGSFESNDGSEDMDGFIFKINPEDGKLMDESNESKSSTRLDSINKKDDYIFNICNDRFDHDAFYVVGKSEGHIRDLSDEEQPPQGSSHAYVAKVNLKSLTAEWLIHFTMTVPGDGMMHGEALSCTVTPDSDGENIVYVGGTVKNGASMVSDTGSTQPHGKDDIFVASLNGSTGDMKWIQQIGTAENDRLASGQGLDVDSFGNVIVYAETMGTFYDEHLGGSDDPDLVVFNINKLNGDYLTPRTTGQGVGSDEIDQNEKLTAPAPKNGIPAIQTNGDAIPSYAGGMHYDKYTNAIYLTGAAYTEDYVSVSKSSRCIFGVATLPQLQFKQMDTLGTSKAPEACSAITFTDFYGESEPIIVGSSEESGLLDNLRTAGRSSQYGMVMELQNNGGRFDLIGGTVVDEEKVQFPVKVLSDEEDIFLVSMASKSDEVRHDKEKADGRKYPNYTMGGVQKYGAQYEILVEKHTITRESDLAPGSASTMTLNWRKPLETADQRSIFVSGMAMIDGGDAVVVVGSTQGLEDGDDFDGIMAKISTSTGAFAEEGIEARSVAYFSSVSGANDWILNVCPDTDDERFFYVVGATGGEMDSSINRGDSDVTVHAVVSKIQTNTLNIIWTTQYETKHASGVTDEAAASVALGCAMVPDTRHIYVAGDVENGAIIEGETTSAGADDIFLAMLDTETGEKIWTKQVGSSGDDRVARGGGVVADANGNAVVFGDTTGSFHRMRDPKNAQTSDLFLMVFNQEDGSHENSMSKRAATKKNTSVRKNPAPTEWFGTKYNRDPRLIGILVGVTVSALFLLISCFVLYRRTRARHELAKQNAIFTYLQKFPVEDIDLRKSPPGGWHGTYLNKLAHGVNTRASMPETPYQDEHPDEETDVLFETAKSLHSKVKDSLFMDTSSTPALGGGGGYSDYSEVEENALQPRNNGDKSNPFSII
jgi:hypothetical protein